MSLDYFILSIHCMTLGYLSHSDSQKYFRLLCTFDSLHDFGLLIHSDSLDLPVLISDFDSLHRHGLLQTSDSHIFFGFLFYSDSLTVMVY